MPGGGKGGGEGRRGRWWVRGGSGRRPGSGVGRRPGEKGREPGLSLGLGLGLGLGVGLHEEPGGAARGGLEGLVEVLDTEASWGAAGSL
jgi:hypothetical protein